MPMLRLTHVRKYLEDIPDQQIVGMVGSKLTTTKHPFCTVLKAMTGRQTQMLWQDDQYVLSVGQRPPRVHYTLHNGMKRLAALLRVWHSETRQTNVTALTLKRMVRIANDKQTSVSPAGQLIRSRYP